MSTARETTQADFDLERFIDMFDEAVSSKDERVVNALRSLMMMTILTKSETYHNPLKDRSRGPLRQMYEDLHDLNSRMYRMEEELQKLRQSAMAVNVNAIQERAYEDVWAEKEKYYLKTASQVSQQFDQTKLNHLKQAALKINGGLLHQAKKEGE